MLIDWFQTIAFALNDDEPSHAFERYPLDKMVAAYNAGVCLVHKYREDLFTELRISKLEAGQYQDLRGCCGKILAVLDQTDADGNTIKPLSSSKRTSTKVNRNWRKPSCLVREGAPDGYVIDNITLDSNMPGRFKVDPPVPCDTNVFVRVKCVTPPCPITEADVNDIPAVPCEMLTALWHFVMARMLTGDRYTETTFNAMQYNDRMFFTILDIVQRQEDKMDEPKESDGGM